MDGVVLAVLETEPWKVAMGHARVFDAGVGGWTNQCFMTVVGLQTHRAGTDFEKKKFQPLRP